jgi:RHS repeat-associated protein
MRAACMLACFLGLQLCGQAWLCAGAAAQPQPPASPMPIVDHEYDAAGNPLRRIEARNSPGFGFTTRHEVDRLHRRRLSTDAGGGEVRWSTTGRGAVLATTDPRGLVTQTPRNGLADMTRLASPDTGQATMRYDAAGLLLQRTDSRGVTASWVHDALGRPSSASWSRGSETPLIHTWAYDEAGPETPYGVGRLTSSQAPRTSNRWGYDAQGRLTRFSQTVLPTPGANLQALGHTVLWHYDAGRLTGITYPSGRRLWLRHDQGRLSSVALSRDATSTPVELITGIVHSPFGAPAGWSWVLANGSLRAHLRQSDETGRLVRTTLGPVWRDLSYDAAGRLVAYTHLDAATHAPRTEFDQAFGYDHVGRLVRIIAWGSDRQIEYDASGNRTQDIVSGQADTYTIDSTSNRLLATSLAPRSQLFDAMGNTTQISTPAGTAEFAYGLDGRLVSYSRGGALTQYTHDAQGRRVRKHGGAGAAGTLVFVHDEQGRLLGEYDRSGQPVREYIWLGELPLAMVHSNPAAPALLPEQLLHLHADHLGAPRAASDRAGRLRWHWMGEPFGSDAPQRSPTGLAEVDLPLRLPGQYFDAESGLHYNLHRDYDAGLGRYSQSDPIGLAGGINTYTYVENRPTMMVDPLGLKGWYCQRPLGKPPGTQGPPLFNHQYLCVTRAGGSVSCGGLTTDGNPLSGEPRLTRPDEDYYDPKSCKEVDDDKDQCFEQCVLRNFSNPNKPRYGIGPLTDCQEYADDLYYGCKILCNMRKGGR